MPLKVFLNIKSGNNVNSILNKVIAGSKSVTFWWFQVILTLVSGANSKND